MASDNAGRAEAVSSETGKVGLGYVYFIESGPYYKIGKTVNLEKRTDQIISSISKNEPKLPFTPRLVAVIGTFEYALSDLERSFHTSFSRERLRGEWFQIKHEDIIDLFSYIDAGEAPTKYPVWLDKIIWKDYAEHLEFPTVIPCPS